MTALATLTTMETRLLTREWAAMVFAFVMPPMMMLVLAGVFANDTDVFGGANGSDYYVAGYLGVPLGALSLVGLPVMLASYRELGVLRRFEAFGVPTAKVVAAQALVTGALVVLGALLVIAMAAPTYGVPAVEEPLAVAVGFVAGAATMISLGVALGLAAPTARAAQALGLLAFMPMWLLGGGGPPQPVMTDAMQRISDVLPLWHTTSAIREPWLGTSGSGDNLLALAGWLAVGLVATALLLRRRSA
ncbi:MAG: ABC transporter permease [Nocardioidaceae bacterium]|nr:ABC transporter permease [Nocardioidaceae bacterium]